MSEEVYSIPHEDFLGQELKEGDKVAFIAGTPPKLYQGIVTGFSAKSVFINECNSKGVPCIYLDGSSVITYVPPKKVAKI